MPRLPNFSEPFIVDDHTPSFTEDNLLAVKIIETFSHLLQVFPVA